LPALKEFYLVGGTSLALQLGHLHSIDIDLFTRNEFSTAALIPILKTSFAECQIDYEGSKTCFSVINKVKVDFIHHPLPPG